MSELRFEWDAGKAVVNSPKHGISFDEAQTAFYDPHSKIRIRTRGSMVSFGSFRQASSIERRVGQGKDIDGIGAADAAKAQDSLVYCIGD